MATINEGMRAYLLASAPIAAIVGDRVHHNKVPEQSVLPWVWYRKASRQAEAMLDGAEEGVVETHYAVECVADDPSEAEDLGELVRLRLNLFRGDLSGFTVLGVFVEDADEDYFPESIDEDEGAHVVAFDVAIMHV